MTSSLKQQKPLASDSTFNEQADQPKGTRSFHKVIFQEMYIKHSFLGFKKQHEKQKPKLFRYRKGPVTQDQISDFKSPQGRKSLKYVRDIALSHPQSKSSYYIKKGEGVNHLRLLLGKLTRCPSIKLNMYVSGNPESPKARFSGLWLQIFKELRKYNPKKLKISIFGDWHDYVKKEILKGLNWWQYTFRLIQPMTNLQVFHLNFRVHPKANFEDSQSRIRSDVDHIKYLSKLREIALGGIEHVINDSVIIYKGMLAPTNIEQVAIRINDPEFSQPIAESLNKLQQLKYLIFQGDLEIPDFLSVLKSHPDLSIVRGVSSWSYDNENISIDALTKHLQLHNITHLYLDLYLPIKSKQDCTFYKTLMGTFVNLESLRIGFDTVKKMDFAGDYADILIPLKKITHLELALSLTLENMTKFFAQMQPLATLKHFTLAANIQVPRTIAKQLPPAVEAFKKFMLSLSSLERFEIHCHKVGLVFLQGMCQVISGIQKLQSITLSFETNSEHYIPVHDTMVAEIQNTAATITNTQEFYVNMITGIYGNFKVPKELVECPNENLKKFKFAMGNKHVLPGYGTRWF